MRPDLRQRVTVALNEVLALDTSAAERYLRALRASDPEVAEKVRALFGSPQLSTSQATGIDIGEPGPTSGPLAETPRGEMGNHHPGSPGEQTSSIDVRATMSFPLPDPTPGRGDGREPRGLARTLGRYRLLQVVGRGAFGEVWKAFDPVLDKYVAVKLARPDRFHPESAFLDEARKAASLRHPAIVHVYDVGSSAEDWHIISEFIDGESLRDRTATGRLPLDQIVRITATVAGALHAAHLAGLVHRDVKPGNILLDRAGNAYLTDFGLAVREEDQFAERRKVSGTLAYMAPEQINGDTHLLDGRADIYALGAVLYELLTGRPLFRAGDIVEYRELILRREPRPPRAVEATVPEALERICLKCLAKEVKDRYRTGEDVAADLEAWLAGSTRTVVEPAPPGPSISRWKPLVVVATALALGIGVVALLGGGRSPSTAPAPPAVVGGAPAVPVPVPARKVPRPKPLLWTGTNQFNKWEVIGTNNLLTVLTEEPALLQLGESSADNWTFSATIQQVGAPGGVGLFLGHPKDTDAGQIRFELISLVAFPDGIDLQRTFETYTRNVPPRRVVCGSAHVPKLLKENTIRLSIRNGQLSEVFFNGEPIPALVEKAPADSHRPAAGVFGVYNRKSDAIFSYPKLNEIEIPLLVDLAPQAPERP